MLDDGSLAWRDLVMIVEGMMVSGMTRKQRLEKLKNMR
jgi:hypothetical protein